MSNIVTLITAFAFIFVSAVPSFSEHDVHSHDHEGHVQKPVNLDNVQVGEGEAVIIVQGIVCTFCSQGVRRKLSKLPFIDSSKYTKGVKVDIEKQKVTIAIKPGSDFEMEEVFRSIKSGGYEPVVAYKNTGNEIVTVYPEG